jgi:integrase
MGYVLRLIGSNACQHKTLRNTFDSDPSLSWNVIGRPPAGDRRSHRAPSNRLALKLAPLVFVRPGELRAAEWSEFDL